MDKHAEELWVKGRCLEFGRHRTGRINPVSRHGHIEVRSVVLTDCRGCIRAPALGPGARDGLGRVPVRSFALHACVAPCPCRQHPALVDIFE